MNAVLDRAVPHRSSTDLTRAPVALDDQQVAAAQPPGLVGVEGNGQAELVEVIMGMIEPVSGTVHLEGEDISDWDVRRIREAGVGYIPEDRHRQGLLLDALRDGAPARPAREVPHAHPAP